MSKISLLAGSALRSVVFVGALSLAGTAAAQTTPTPQEVQKAEKAQQSTDPEAAPTQDQLDPANADEDDTIRVTGSRIPRPQFEGVIPGTQITSEQIEKRNFTHLYDVLAENPLVYDSGVNPYGVNGGAQPVNLGLSFVNLLGLGSNRTLTLVNGRRFMPGGSATSFVAGGGGVQVDVGAIPAGMVERMDLLTVGGAAVYGSDAVSGIVNIILKDDFEGLHLTGRNSLTTEGDGADYNVNLLAGRNFAEGRGNVTIGLEYSLTEGLLGSHRPDRYVAYFGGLANPLDGTRRNPNFVPTLSITADNGAFLNPATDGQAATLYGLGFAGGNYMISGGGTIFAPNAAAQAVNYQGFAVNPVTATNSQPAAFASITNVALVPYLPLNPTLAQCSAALATCKFAPSSLGSLNPNAVIAKYAPGFSTAGATQAQLVALAVNLLQANLPTPMEYYAQHPNTDINAFIGSFAVSQSAPAVAGFFRLANPDPSTSGQLPFIAAPLRFDNNGNVVDYVIARMGPGIAGTYGSAVGGDFENATDTLLLRTQQERATGVLNARFDLTDNLTLYTENLFGRVSTRSLRENAPGNNIGATSTETAGLVMNINNPFLDAADRAKLSKAGVTKNFLLSRTNRDITSGDFNTNRSDNYRSLVGLRGNFNLLGRAMSFDVAAGYGRVDTYATTNNIKDIEFALAIDAVDEGFEKTGVANGNIICRAQLTGTTALPRGVRSKEIVRTLGPDGVVVEKIVDRTVTAQQVAACKPLNPFGYNQMSQASKDYVFADTWMKNTTEQYIAEANVQGSFFDLPAGPFGFGLTGAYRKESFDFTVDDLSLMGATRTVAFAETQGTLETAEFGIETRIPIFGEDFNIPLFRNLSVEPSVRFINQNGYAPDLKHLNGTVEERKYKGGWNQIWSLAGTWRPIRDVTVRGNYTSSIRAASVVELFLGGQPQILNTTDPCATVNIDQPVTGVPAGTRRKSCELAAIEAGVATDTASAKTFLQSWNPGSLQLLGTAIGTTDIKPERGKSWTVGAVLSPRFIPGLMLSADYINLTLEDRIVPASASQALVGCYDSIAYPETPQFTVNLCGSFPRAKAGDPIPFQLQNGYQLGSLNQGALHTEALIINGSYNLRLNDIFGGSADIGQLQLAGTANHLISFLTSPSNDLHDPGIAGAEGTFGFPKWRVTMRVGYSLDGFYAQWVGNWTDKIFVVYGNPDISESLNFSGVPSYMLHNVAMGYSFGRDQRFGLGLSVSNLLDTRYVGNKSIAYGTGYGLVDEIGRRVAISANIRF